MAEPLLALQYQTSISNNFDSKKCKKKIEYVFTRFWKLMHNKRLLARLLTEDILRTSSATSQWSFGIIYFSKLNHNEHIFFFFKILFQNYYYVFFFNLKILTSEVFHVIILSIGWALLSKFIDFSGMGLLVNLDNLSKSHMYCFFFTKENVTELIQKSHFWNNTSW